MEVPIIRKEIINIKGIALITHVIDSFEIIDDAPIKNETIKYFIYMIHSLNNINI